MSMQLMPTLASMSDVSPAYFLAPVGGLIALIMAKLFHGSVMKKSEGDENMVEIAQAVRDGAMAYLGRQYKVVAGVFVLLIVFLGIMYALKLQSAFTLVGVPVAGLRTTSLSVVSESRRREVIKRLLSLLMTRSPLD